MDSFCLNARHFSNHFVTNEEYLTNVFIELGVVSEVKTYVYDTKEEGCTYHIYMKSWTKQGERVRDAIAKGTYVYNGGTKTQPDYFVLEKIETQNM
jgi:hypothetical protein